MGVWDAYLQEIDTYIYTDMYGHVCWTEVRTKGEMIMRRASVAKACAPRRRRAARRRGKKRSSRRTRCEFSCIIYIVNGGCEIQPVGGERVRMQ